MREPEPKRPAAPRRAGQPKAAAFRAAASAAGRARPATGAARAPVEGGKALARLALYSFQRGIDGGDGDGDEVPPSPSQMLAALSEPVPAAGGRVARAGSPRVGAPEAAQAEPPSYLAAFERLKESVAAVAPAVPALQAWRYLGPICIPHGQTYGKPPGDRPSISGRIAAVAVDASNLNHLLAGAAGGGVWESADGGKTWAPRTDDQPSLAIGALAFDATDQRIVYAGTGEGNTTFAGYPCARGVGLLRSVNGGTTWALHASAPFERVGFFDLLVDPTDPGHILAATTAGLYESKNGGKGWDQRRDRRTWTLSFRPPAGPGTKSEFLAACDDGIFGSANGKTWHPVALPGSPGIFVRAAARHAPSQPGVAFVFAAGPPQNDPTPFLWRRGTAAGAFIEEDSLPGDLDTSQAWYDWFLAVAPNNPDTLYIGAIDVHKGVRRTRGGWDWSKISAKDGRDSIHPDEHAIAFSPADPNVVYVGNDGGLYRSPDGGNRWESLNPGLCITEVQYLAQHPVYESWLIAGTQDNGTMRHEGGEVWYHVEDGDGGHCGQSADQPYTCFHTFYGMGLHRSKSGGGWGSWEEIGPPYKKSESYPNGALFYPPVAVDGALVVQAGAVVFFSTDYGDTWSRVGLPPGSGLASALTIATPQKVYVGTTTGAVFAIARTGAGWSAATALATPAKGYISDLRAHPSQPNRVWVTYSASKAGRVYVSANGGGAWAEVTGNLPANLPVNSIEVDPKAAGPGALYVGTDVGVYRSTDGGATWTVFSHQLPNVLVQDLLLHAPSRRLRAATQSRGVWEIQVDEQQGAAGAEIYIRDSAVDSGRLSPSPSDVEDPFHKGARVFWWQCPDLKVDSPTFQTPDIGDDDPVVFEDDHGVAAAGLIDQSPQRGMEARVYVRVHNGGTAAATSVHIKVFYIAAAMSWPDLPVGFWTGIPANTLPAGSPWQAIASHQTVAQIDPGRSAIVAFQWSVPGDAPDHVTLLVVIDAANDPIAPETRLKVADLVPNNRKCGIKNLAVIDPVPGTAPRVRALVLDLWPTPGELSLVADPNGRILVRGLVLSKRLAGIARASGLATIKLTPADKESLAQLIERDPRLKSVLKIDAAFEPPPKASWLASFTLPGTVPEPMALLLKPRPRAARASLSLRRKDELEPVGGYTLAVREPLIKS